MSLTFPVAPISFSWIGGVGYKPLKKAGGNWCALWKLKVPPKVKHSLWRLCRDVLPTCSNLAHRHVDVEDNFM